MGINGGTLFKSLLIALSILLLPILPYKYQVDACFSKKINFPDVCSHIYIPFEEGFPFKFYFNYGPGFATYPFLNFLGRDIPLINCQDMGCQQSISWLVPLFLDIIILTGMSFAMLTWGVKLRFGKTSPNH